MITPLQQTILEAALPLIVFEGWTMKTLEHAARDAGLPAIDAQRAFPEGAGQCIRLWSQQLDQQMETSLKQDYNLPTMKIRERIATAVLVRLKLMQPHREAIRRAAAYNLMPWHSKGAMASLYQTVDCMWRAAGDTSTDFNFYTKRALLSKVYLSTFVIWLEDDSFDLFETTGFLHRRIDDVMQIQKFKGKVRQIFDKLNFIPSKTAI